MQQRQSQLAIAYNPSWLTQADWDDPLDSADLTHAFPATSREFVTLDDTTEDVLNCTGEDLLDELLTARIGRLSVDMDFDPDVFLGVAAMAYGVAAAPTGGTDEVQTETVTATGGTRTLTVKIGTNSQTTAAIAYNANAATIQAALEALSNVGVGDIVVSGSGPYVYTFSGTAFEKQDVNLITVNTFGLTGGTSTFATTTPGVGLLHAISRVSGFSLPLTSFYIGYRGSDKNPVLFKNVVVDSIRVRGASREKVTATFSLIGSGELADAGSFTMPECQDILPLRFGDCKMKIAGTDFIDEDLGREFEYYYQNDVNPKFDGQGIYATRHERADQRPSQFNFWVLGEPQDSWYNLAAARNNYPVELQLGPDGRHVKCVAPQALVKLGATPIRHAGDPPESELVIEARPRKVSGDATTPSSISGRSFIQDTLLSANP